MSYDAQTKKIKATCFASALYKLIEQMESTSPQNALSFIVHISKNLTQTDVGLCDKTPKTMSFAHFPRAVAMVEEIASSTFLVKDSPFWLFDHIDSCYQDKTITVVFSDCAAQILLDFKKYLNSQELNQ